MKIALITQAPGFVTQIDERAIHHTGNRSCALYVHEQNILGNRVTQFHISEIDISDNHLYHKETLLDLSTYDAVVRRAWDGAENSLRSLIILRLLEKQYPRIYADNPAKTLPSL